MSQYTITLMNRLGSGTKTKLIFSIDGASSLRADEGLVPKTLTLVNPDSPKKLNDAHKAVEMFRAWFRKKKLEQNAVLNVFIDGDPFFAFYIVKDLLRTQTNFKIVIKSQIFTQEDYLVSKFRQFVLDSAILDFTNISNSISADYPSSFVTCLNPSCKHQNRNFLETTEKFLGVSVVIPTKDVPSAWLEKLLSQVSTQIGTNDEIIVIDDNETQRDFGKLTDLYRNLRILNGKGDGVSSARNLGVSESRKDLVLFVDSDDEILPEFIDSQRNFHMKFRNVSASGFWLQAFGSHNRVYPQWDGFSPLGIFQCLPPAGVLMWKREALNQIGAFRDDFAKGFEDFDLVARAIASDHLIVTFEDVNYLYRRGHGSLSQSLSPFDQSELLRLVWRNAKYLCDDNFIKFIELGLVHGEKLNFDSANYIFFGEEKRNYLSQFVRLARNNHLVRSIWALIPQKLRSMIFKFAMKH